MILCDLVKINVKIVTNYIKKFTNHNDKINEYGYLRVYHLQNSKIQFLLKHQILRYISKKMNKCVRKIAH